MALQAVCEVALHFGNFRNVDLLYQGIYHLRCRVFEESVNGAPEVNAVPHTFQSLPVDASAAFGHDGLPQACVLEDQAMFCTKSVMIRYCGEQEELNDAAIFRLERHVGKDEPLTIELQLLYTDMPLPPSPGRSPGRSPGDRQSQARLVNEASGPDLQDFVVVSTHRLRLHQVMQGIHAFCPISFDELHLCCVDLMVHSTILDFRLRIRPEVPLGRPAGPGRSLKGAIVELAADLSLRELEVGSTHGSEPSLSTRESVPTTRSNGARGGSGGVVDPVIHPTGERLPFADAVDLVQRNCIARLLRSHEDLMAFLQDTAANDASVQTDKQAVSAALQLPNCDSPEATKWPGGLVPISARLGPHDPQEASTAARLLFEDVSFVAVQVLAAWQAMLTASLQAMEAVVSSLQTSWCKNLVRHMAEGVFSRISRSDSISEPVDEETTANNVKAVWELRHASTSESARPHLIEDLEAVPPALHRPVIFEQRYSGLKANVTNRFVSGGLTEHRRDGLEQCKGVHLFVFVHGFQGSSYDMRLIRNNIMLLHPEALCLCSAANEEDTEGNIEYMGERLASEVRSYIEEWCTGEPPAPPLQRLSFISHSVGGLIARAALPLLAEFHDRMHAFLSFSSPHLGYLYTPNSIFKAGLWVVKRLRKSKCLEQLSLTDAAEKGSCFLSRLSEMPGLQYFKHVVLMSSRQDHYAPFESARIEMPREAEADPDLGPCYDKMLRNILGPLEAERVIRIEVNFHIPEANIDSAIGRTAHIQFIENQAFMRMLILTHGFLFTTSCERSAERG